MMLLNRILYLMLSAALFISCNHHQKNDSGSTIKYKPELTGAWWQVAGNPDLGELNSDEQQPVDFAIWQALDGKWQIWSCIRKTKAPGNTRLFYGWEGDSITQENWTPKGIMMQADTAFGESPGGLQAPYVIKKDGNYLMFYGDWKHICLAESDDGKNFKRVLVNGSPALFGDTAETNTRDPMVIQIDHKWYCYYVAHPNNDGAIYLRTSDDLRNWSASKVVSHGGSIGTGKLWMAECAHVVPYEGNYLLFRTYSYGTNKDGRQVDEPKTNIYCSSDPTDFGVDTDSLLVQHLPVAAPEIVHYKNEWYIAALMPDLQGIRISKMKWITTDIN